MNRNLLSAVLIGLAGFVIIYMLAGGQPTRWGEAIWAVNATIANLALIIERRRGR